MLPKVSEKIKKRMIEIAKEMQNKKTPIKKIHNLKEKKKGTRGECSV